MRESGVIRIFSYKCEFVQKPPLEYVPLETPGLVCFVCSVSTNLLLRKSILFTSQIIYWSFSFQETQTQSDLLQERILLEIDQLLNNLQDYQMLKHRSYNMDNNLQMLRTQLFHFKQTVQSVFVSDPDAVLNEAHKTLQRVHEVDVYVAEKRRKTIGYSEFSKQASFVLSKFIVDYQKILKSKGDMAKVWQSLVKFVSFY